MNLKLNLELFTELLDTETDHLGSGDLCGRLVQAAKLVQEDVRVEIATRDAAQVIVTNKLMNMITMMKAKMLLMIMILMMKI